MELAIALRNFINTFAEAVADGRISSIELVRIVKRTCQLLIAALEFFVPEARKELQDCAQRLAEIKT